MGPRSSLVSESWSTNRAVGRLLKKKKKRRAYRVIHVNY